MWDVLGNDLTRFGEVYTPLSEADLSSLHKIIPDNVAMCRVRGLRSKSASGIEHELIRRYFSFCTPIEQGEKKNVDTIVFVLPGFCFQDYTSTYSTHLGGYRDLDNGRILTNSEGMELDLMDSLSLIHEYKSAKNFYPIDYCKPNRSHTLGYVFGITQKFRDNLVDYCGEAHRTLVPKIFIVTNSYFEKSDIDSFKSLHIIMKGMYKALGIKDSVPLRRWIENYRRQGAKTYLNQLVNEHKSQRSNLIRSIDNLKNQMSDYFRELTPIDFFLRDQEAVLKKINLELVNCEKIKGVKSAYLDGDGSFHMFTEHIYIKQSNSQVVAPGLTPEERSQIKDLYWDIGKLHITVKKNGYTYIIGNTRLVAGFGGRMVSHPHVVDQDNGVCLGDIEVVVHDLINRHEYTSLAGILINFARSVNLNDSAGETVRAWPTVQLNRF